MKKQIKNVKDKNENKKNIIKENSDLIKNVNSRVSVPIIKDDDIFDFESKNIKEKLIFSKPCEIFPEWPSEEELKVINSIFLLLFFNKLSSFLIIIW